MKAGLRVRDVVWGGRRCKWRTTWGRFGLELVHFLRFDLHLGGTPPSLKSVAEGAAKETDCRRTSLFALTGPGWMSDQSIRSETPASPASANGRLPHRQYEQRHTCPHQKTILAICGVHLSRRIRGNGVALRCMAWAPLFCSNQLSYRRAVHSIRRLAGGQNTGSTLACMSSPSKHLPLNDEEPLSRRTSRHRFFRETRERIWLSGSDQRVSPLKLSSPWTNSKTPHWPPL